MGLIDAATAPLRYVLGGTERDAEAVAPLRDLEQMQVHLVGAVEAIKLATEQIEAHVQVIETLATALSPLTVAVVALAEQMQALPELTGSVVDLSAKLDVVVEVLAPLAHAEQDISHVGHLFSRRRGVPPAEA